MPDNFYDNFRNVIFGGGTGAAIDLNDAGTTIKVMLRDEGADALNLADDMYDDISAGAIGTDQAVATKTVGTAGTGAFDHDNVTWTAVTGASVESLDYYKDTGTPSTSQLICNIDSATGLPVTPNGGNITWTPAAGGVFQIT